MSLKITICCCNSIFGEGIQRLIKEDAPGNDCIITISSQRKVIRTKPDILITDFHTLSTLSLDTLLKHKVGILLLWTGCLPALEDGSILGFISRGLIGVLSPEASPSELKKAIKSAVSGELWFERRKLKNLICCRQDATVEIHQLTGKEIEIVKLICKGYRNKEIMRNLCIAEQTVKKHLNNIYKKAGITDRLQLAIYAIRHWSSYL